MPLASLNSTGKTNQVRQHGAMEFSDPPVDLDKVRLERLARFRKKMAIFLRKRASLSRLSLIHI